MKHAPRMLTSCLVAIALLVAARTAPAQDEKPIRTNLPTITVIEEGKEPRTLHRWNMTGGGGGVILVTSRTGRIPDREGRVDPGTIEIMYTLQGALFRTKPVKKMVWQILDASAKLANDPLRSPRYAKPGEDPAGPLAVEEDNPAGSDNGSQSLTGSGEAQGIDPKAEAHSRTRLRLRTSVLSLQKIQEGILRQAVTPNGILASGAVAILEKQTARGYSEAMKLASLLGLVQVLLPDGPIGVGARWQSTIRNDSSNTPVNIEITWTLKSVEGSRMKLGMNYTRRLATAANDPRSEANRRRVERNGRGEINIDLEQPLAISADLVEELVFPPHFTPEQRRDAEATWISVKPVPTPTPTKTP